MTTKPQIAIDIDGVVVDFTNQVFVPTLNTVCGLDIDPNYHPDQWSFNPGLCTEDQERKAWESPNLHVNLAKARPLPQALALFRSVQSLSTFITSRGIHAPYEDQNVLTQGITREWLTSYGLTAPVMFVPSHEKADVACAMGITTAFEDHPQTCLDYA